MGAANLWFRGREPKQLAMINLDHRVEARRMRLSHTFKSSFGQFDHPVITDEKIVAGVKGKAVGHGRIHGDERDHLHKYRASSNSASLRCFFEEWYRGLSQCSIFLR
jgi:hypothetical protein